MTLLPDPRRVEPTNAGSSEGSECGLASLDPFVYQEMRWCVNCAGQQIFAPMFETDFGRVGLCMGCGEEKIVPFSRSTERAA